MCLYNMFVYMNVQNEDSYSGSETAPDGSYEPLEMIFSIVVFSSHEMLILVFCPNGTPSLSLPTH
jgi:hypothetical protein